jgi:hypothetical protein
MAWERRASERPDARAKLGRGHTSPRLAWAFALVLPLTAALGACRQTVVLDPLAQTDGGAGAGGNAPVVDAAEEPGGKGGGGMMGGNHADGGRNDALSFCLGGQIQRVPITMRTPDIIVSVDRSSAMQSFFGNGTRLQVIQQQVRALIAKYRVVRFGYEEFPSTMGTMGMCGNGQGCCAGNVTLPTYDNLKAIDRAISACDSNGPGCNQMQRPVADALSKCWSTYDVLFSMSDTGHRYVLLLLGGDPTCTGSDPMAMPCDNAVAAVTKLARSNINTAIIGVGDGAVGSACLDQLALYGGLTSGGASPLYHLARTPTDLSSALDPLVETIAEEACKIDVRMPPADPTKLLLLFDGLPVPNDGVDGWTFDQDTNVSLTVHGSYCHSLIQSTPQVDLVTGCPSSHN